MASTKMKTMQENMPNLRDIKETYDLYPHPVTGRLIDTHPGKRTKPMRVLGMGMSRTGTMSFFTSLQMLGYKPYHMATAIGSPKSNLDVWREALEAKFNNKPCKDGKVRKWGREEFDKLLGEYDAVADVPAILFAEELQVAYPEAKVVLTNRDVDSWLRSMSSTAGVVFSWPAWPLVAQWDPQLTGPFWAFAKCTGPIAFRTLTEFSPTGPARAAFQEHYTHVRKVTPKENLLEFRVQEGWEPLCKFLEVPVPQGDYPNVNDSKEFVKFHKVLWWLGFGKMVGKIGLMAGVPLVVVAAAMMWQRQSNL